MSTIAPSRLKNVENTAEFIAFVQDTFDILAEEIAKRVATCQNLPEWQPDDDTSDRPRLETGS